MREGCRMQARRAGMREGCGMQACRARMQAGCVPGHERAVQGHAPAVPGAAGEGARSALSPHLGEEAARDLRHKDGVSWA